MFITCLTNTTLVVYCIPTSLFFFAIREGKILIKIISNVTSKGERRREKKGEKRRKQGRKGETKL